MYGSNDYGLRHSIDDKGIHIMVSVVPPPHQGPPETPSPVIHVKRTRKTGDDAYPLPEAKRRKSSTLDDSGPLVSQCITSG